MKYDIKLVAYNEGEFMQDSGSLSSESTIEVSINPRMRESGDGDDFLVMQLTVIYRSDKKEIMRYGGVAVYHLEKLSSYKNDTLAMSEIKQEMWGQALGFFRGIICEKLRGTDLGFLFLPYMPEEEIEKIEIQKK
ncbi:MAG: hypothetical protein K2J23_04140 [Muribaculaceae bacterium]|nr:hypothetical protein [Muribaculaceae bacterium]